MLLEARLAGRHRVKVAGLARPTLAGRRVTIRALVGHRRIGRPVRATVALDGTFAANLRRPARRHLRRVGYQASIAGERSRALRLRRRLTIRSRRVRAGATLITGQLTGRRRTVTVTRRISCTGQQRVTAVRPNRRGRFTVTLPAPGFYRMTAGRHALEIAVT
jgi:hypothetical protein